MDIITSTPLSVISQRMNKDVTMYLHSHPDCAIDELLVVAATPALRTDFKNVEKKELRGILQEMMHFLKTHQRFLNFTKEAVIEGLRKE